MSERSWFLSLEKKFAAAIASDQTTPEEMEQIQAERKAMQDTRWELAQMMADGSIEVRISQNGPGGIHGSFESTIQTGDTRYAACKSEYELSEPGQSVEIKKRWKNDSWVIEMRNTTSAQRVE